MNTTSPTHSAITQRAHEIWKGRGSPVGLDNEIWLEAERQLKTHAPDTKQATRESSRVLSAPKGGAAEQERLRGEMASESEVEFQITPAPSDDEAIKAALQKKEARAPKIPHKDAPHAKPVESGKPLWDKPHSS